MIRIGLKWKRLRRADRVHISSEKGAFKWCISGFSLDLIIHGVGDRMLRVMVKMKGRPSILEEVSPVLICTCDGKLAWRFGWVVHILCRFGRK